MATKVFGLRVSPELMQEIETAAKAAGLKPTEWAVDALRKALEPPVETPATTLAEPAPPASQAVPAALGVTPKAPRGKSLVGWTRDGTPIIR